MRAALVPCPSCSRHVRSTEPTCPFCAGALAAETAGMAEIPVGERISRAALAALTATGALAVGACGPSLQQGPAVQQPTATVVVVVQPTVTPPPRDPPVVVVRPANPPGSNEPVVIVTPPDQPRPPVRPPVVVTPVQPPVVVVTPVRPVRPVRPQPYDPGTAVPAYGISPPQLIDPGAPVARYGAPPPSPEDGPF